MYNFREQAKDKIKKLGSDNFCKHVMWQILKQKRKHIFCVHTNFLENIKIGRSQFPDLELHLTE